MEELTSEELQEYVELFKSEGIDLSDNETVQKVINIVRDKLMEGIISKNFVELTDSTSDLSTIINNLKTDVNKIANKTRRFNQDYFDKINLIETILSNTKKVSMPKWGIATLGIILCIMSFIIAICRTQAIQSENLPLAITSILSATIIVATLIRTKG